MTYHYTLENYRAQITELAKTKGWLNSPTWLALGMFKEVGELYQEYERWKDYVRKLDENGLTPTLDAVKDFENNIAGEFAGVMHYLIQFVHEVAIAVNLGDALDAEIEKNRTTKKKTLDENGEIVRK